MFYETKIEKYELVHHRVTIPTGSFISVALYFSADGNEYHVREVISEGEMKCLAGRLMKKIERNYPLIYFKMNEQRELQRIKAEIDNAFFKTSKK